MECLPFVSPKADNVATTTHLLEQAIASASLSHGSLRNRVKAIEEDNKQLEDDVRRLEKVQETEVSTTWA
jgi:hypothetical protein